MPDFYSFSRLSKYGECSEYFRLYYVDRPIPRPDTNSVATVMGTIVHEILEDYYGPVIDRAVPVGTLLDNFWEEELDRLGVNPELFYSVVADWGKLYLRASEDYVGPGAIRTGKGGVSKQPQMTRAWSDAVKNMKLVQRTATISKVAGEVEKKYRNVSLPMVYMETHAIFDKFVDTLKGMTIHALELQFTRKEPDGSLFNPVQFPGFDTYLTGFIDLVVTDQYENLGIIDHKTSKKPYEVHKVEQMDQLLLYGWAHWVLTDRWPNFVAVNDLRRGELVRAPFDEELAWAAVNRKMQEIDGIEKRVFLQKSPVEYGSPCYNDYKGDNKGCPYLAHCHPVYAQRVAAR